VTLRWWAVVAWAALAGGAMIMAVRASDATWQSILAGVATTALAIAVVEAIALVERQRQERPVSQMVGRRIGRLHQTLISIVQTVFDDQRAEPRNWPAVLRQIPDRAEDFESTANVYPPRTRRVYLHQLVRNSTSKRVTSPGWRRRELWRPRWQRSTTRCVRPAL